MTADLDSTTALDPITNVRPRDPWIKVLFHGLMTGCFRDAHKTYEVGLLQDNDHTIQLNIWDSNGKHSQPFDEKSKKATLRINHKDSGKNLVRRFQVGANFDRRFDPGPFSDLRHDFRWALDFEGGELHSVELTKNAGRLTPRFRIENGGVLFTLVRSVPILKNRVEEGNARTRLLGRIAQIMAAYIDLPDFPDDQHPAELFIDDSYKFTFDPNKRYEIVLRNDCPEESPDCFYEGDVLDTTLLKAAFQKPPNQEFFLLLLGLDGDLARAMVEVELANGIRNECGLELGNLFSFLRLTDDKILASRYNPCGKAFYGQSTSLDEPRAALNERMGTKE